jgi:hypothetical protein
VVPSSILTPIGCYREVLALNIARLLDPRCEEGARERVVFPSLRRSRAAPDDERKETFARGSMDAVLSAQPYFRIFSLVAPRACFGGTGIDPQWVSLRLPVQAERMAIAKALGHR